MAFSYTGGDQNSGNSGTASTGTHGLTINSGDLVAVWVHREGTASITADDSGWTNPIDESPAGINYTHSLYWMKAGGSEPSAYTYTLGSSGRWNVMIKVFSSTEGDFEVDAAASTALEVSVANDIIVGAIDGAVLSDNCVSLVGGFKGSRSTSSEEYTVVDNSFVSPFGILLEAISASAHRIYTTGETFSGDVTIETADSNDARNIVSYSSHISFTEVAAGGFTPKGVFSRVFTGPFGGPI